MNFAKLIAAAAVAATLMVPATAQAQQINPTGSWQTKSGEARVNVSLCGDGTQLCATLTWLRADARSPENLALLNHMVVDQARWTAANRWSGTVSYGGDSVRGSVTLVSDNEIKVTGCMGMACQALEFVRL